MPRRIWFVSLPLHAGKALPHPVDRQVYERTIDVLGEANYRAGIDRSEKVHALRRLNVWGQARRPGRI